MTTKQNQRRKPDPRLSRLEWTLLGVGLAILMVIGVWAGILLADTWKAAQAVRADVEALQALAEGGIANVDAGWALELLRTTRVDLARLQETARPLLALAPLLGWVPRYGGDIAAAPALLEVGLKLTEAGEVAATPLLPLFQELQAQSDVPQEEVLERAFRALEGARPQFERAAELAQEAVDAREQIDTSRLDPRVQGYVTHLDRYLPLLVPALKGAPVLPQFLGASAPRTYLILVQNEDEIRATGGFISAVAQVTVDRGKLVELGFLDSYLVDDFSKPYPDPPAPLTKYMLSELWLFRDSNWSPDYPTSARCAINLYAIGQGVMADGAIAIDQHAVRALIGALGPLHVKGVSEPVTGEGVIHIVREGWNLDEQTSDGWWSRRKDSMAAVLTAVADRVQEGIGQADLARLAIAALDVLEEKHLLVYVRDVEAASVVADVGWDGALAQGEGDALMVVDTNVGFNKANPLIRQEIEYAVDLSGPDEPYATLTVTHTHTLQRSDVECRHESVYGSSYQDMMERCYWSYMRVYVPLGASLVRATPHEVPAESLISERASPAHVSVGPPELGREVFATLLLVRPAEAVKTVFEYALPSRVIRVQGEQSAYCLGVQKQPGTRGIPIRVQIVLPPGARQVVSDPAPAETSASELVFSGTLDRDWSLCVRWQALR